MRFPGIFLRRSGAAVLLSCLAAGCAAVLPPIPHEGWVDERTGIQVFYGEPRRPYEVDSTVETSAWSLSDRRREALNMLLDKAVEIGADAVIGINLGVSGRGMRRVGTASGTLVRWTERELP